MFGNRSVEIFKLFGFSVRIDWSWTIIAVLLTWSLATTVFPHSYPSLSTSAYWWMGICGALGLFLSIILHELGHALAARQYGVEMRGITLFIFGGVAEMRDEPPSPMAEFVIAIAGPLVSVAIAAAGLGLDVFTARIGWPQPVRGVLAYLGTINAILVAFNLIPAFPLDGGRVLRALLWSIKGSLRWATRITSAIGSGFAILLMLLGVLSVFTGNFFGGMWLFVLGLFLRGAAQMSYQQLLVRRALEGESVSRFMQTDVQTVPPSATIQEFVDDYVYKHHFKMFPITDNGALVGCMTTRKIREVPREQWSQHTVTELAESCSEENTIGPDTDAMAALAKMSQNGHSRLMVVRDGKLQGIVALRDMMRFISWKVELEQ